LCEFFPCNSILIKAIFRGVTPCASSDPRDFDVAVNARELSWGRAPVSLLSSRHVSATMSLDLSRVEKIFRAGTERGLFEQTGRNVGGGPLRNINPSVNTTRCARNVEKTREQVGNILHPMN